MIVLAEKKDLVPIAQYQETDSFACRILCIANMYENYPFVDFWIQKKEEAEPYSISVKNGRRNYAVCS